MPTDLDLAIWRESLHPRDHRGRFAKKTGFAKRFLSASLEERASEFFDFFTKPVEGKSRVFDTDFGPLRLTYSGDRQFTQHGDEPMFNAEKQMPNGEWRGTGIMTSEQVQFFISGGTLKGASEFAGTDAERKFFGIDPDRFLKRRVVEGLPKGWKQSHPEEAYAHYPEMAKAMYGKDVLPALLFVSDDKDIINITSDERWSDEEISRFVKHAGEALDLASGIDPAIRRTPVTVIVPHVWDVGPELTAQEAEGVKGFVRPVIPDVVNINPSTLNDGDETRWDGYWSALNERGHFVLQGENVDPQTYFTLHELGHISDARGPHKTGFPNPHSEDWDFHDRLRHRHSLYGAGSAPEGYAEAFAQWALAVKNGFKLPPGTIESRYLNEDSEVSLMVRRARQAKREKQADRRRLAESHLEVARMYAERYGWLGNVEAPDVAN